jgi:hypothetical protein
VIAWLVPLLLFLTAKPARFLKTWQVVFCGRRYGPGIPGKPGKPGGIRVPISTGKVGISVSSSGGIVGSPCVGGGAIVEPAGIVAIGVEVIVAVPVAVPVGVSLGTGVSVTGPAVAPAVVASAGGEVAAGTSVAGTGVCVGTSVGVPAPQANVANNMSMSKIARAFISPSNFCSTLRPAPNY